MRQFRISFNQSLPELTFQSTPLEGVYRRGAFRHSRHRAVHLSDALRMAVIFKVEIKNFLSKKNMTLPAFDHSTEDGTWISTL